MTNTLLVYVMIKAIDQASVILERLGIKGLAGINPLVVGAAAVAGGLAAITVESLKLANAFDYQMQKIAALTDTTPKMMESYKAALLAMAPALDQAPTELAKGLYFVISAGYKGQAALDILTLSAKAAAATMTPMATVSDLLTTAMGNFKNQGLTAGHAMDDLIKIVVNGKVHMQSLGTSFGFVAIQASVAQMSFDQTSAAVSTLSQIAGEHGSRRVMMDLSNAIRAVQIQSENVSKKAEKMKGLKEPWDAAKFAALDFFGKLKYIQSETGGFGALDMAQAKAYEVSGGMKNLAQATAHANTNFMSLVGGAAAMIPAAMLLGDTVKVNGKQVYEYNEILKQMGGTGKETANAFDIMRKSSTQMTKMIETGFTSIFTLIGESLEPAWKSFLAAVYSVTSGVLKFISDSKNLEMVRNSMIGMAIVAVAVLTPAILTAGGAFLATFGPIALAVLAVVAAGYLLGQHLGQLMSLYQRFTGYLKAHEVAMDAAKAALVGISVAILVSAIPALIAGAGALWGMAAAAAAAAAGMLIAALPFVLIALGIALVVFGIIELVRHWKQVQAFFGQLAAQAGAAFSALGSAVHAGLAAIGQKFSDFGTSVHNTLMAAGRRILDALTWPYRQVSALAVWLYQHNYYVQHLVDNWRRNLTALAGWLRGALADIAQHFERAWQRIQQGARRGFTLLYQDIVQPVQRGWAVVTGLLGKLADWLGQQWDTIKTGAEIAWKAFTRGLQTQATLVWNAAKGALLDPILKAWDQVQKPLAKAGSNLMRMIADDIKRGAQWVADAAKGALKGLAGWLGFHSPAPNVPESAQWGANLVKMFAMSMQGAQPTLLSQSQSLMATLARTLGAPLSASAGLAGGSASDSLAAAARSGALLPGAGGGNVSHVYNVTFPGVKTADEVKKAMEDLEQQNMRRGRRAGSFGGLRPGIDTLT